jgi:hypothetical protein
MPGKIVCSSKPSGLVPVAVLPPIEVAASVPDRWGDESFWLLGRAGIT